MSAHQGEPYRLEEPDTSLGELFGRLSSDFGELVRTHIELAKVEIKDEAAQGARAGAMLGAAAVAGLFALLLVSFAAAWGLAELMPPGLAFLIVGLIWAVAAGALGVVGRRRLQQIDPTPHETVEQLKEDRRWLSEQTS